MDAIVIGGTGLTGSFVVRQLLADADVTRVVSVSRRSLGITSAKLTEVLIPDLEALPAIEPQLRGDLYFCCLGTTMKTAGSKASFTKVDHDAVVAFGEIAKAHHCRSLTVVSAMGASAGSMVFYNQVKGRTEDDLRALGLRSLTLFRPGLLTGPRQEVRRGERIATGILVPLARLFPSRWRKRLITDAATLAERMLAEGKAAPEGVHVIPAKDI